MSKAIEATTARQRAQIAAAHIAGERGFTRALDNCFEMGDGHEVAALLYLRIRKNPTGKLARNITKYLSPFRVFRADYIAEGLMTESEADEIADILANQLSA